MSSKEEDRGGGVEVTKHWCELHIAVRGAKPARALGQSSGKRGVKTESGRQDREEKREGQNE